MWGLPHGVVAPRQEPKIPRSYTRILRLDEALVRHIERSALLPYPAAEVYALVNDIEGYPQYIKWCKAAEIVESGDG